jgi:hypothetical protein
VLQASCQNGEALCRDGKALHHDDENAISNGVSEKPLE